MENIVKALRWFVIPFFAIFLMSHNVSAYTAKPISVNSLEYYGTYTAQSNAGLASNCELEYWPYVSQNGCNNALANGSWVSSESSLPFMTGEVFLNNKAKYSAMTQLRIPFSPDPEMAGQHFMFEFDMDITNSNGNELSTNQFNLIYGRTSTCKISLNDYTIKDKVSCTFVTIDENPIGQILIDMDLSEYSYTSGDSFVIAVYGPWGYDTWGDYYENPLIANLSSTDLYFNWSAVWYVPDAGSGAIEDIVNDWKDKQEQAAADVSAQSPEDIANATNQQTTNIIGIISSFLSAITNFSAGTCDLALDFPSYAGGVMTVNVCQNRDRGGNLIALFTSLTLIMFYLPLAFKLLSMIYNEIRSFTNG